MSSLNTTSSLSGFSSPTQKVLALQNQIKSLTTSLSSGMPVLSAQQQSDVVSLSKQTATESAALTSISAAKLALTSAQKQLDAVDHFRDNLALAHHFSGTQPRFALKIQLAVFLDSGDCRERYRQGNGIAKQVRNVKAEGNTRIFMNKAELW